MDNILSTYEEKMTKSYNNLESEFTTIRAGRANPHILDKITVDYYGAPTPLQQVANISVPEPRLIQIQPWETSLVKEIEKAINMESLFVLYSQSLLRNVVRKSLRMLRSTARMLRLQSETFVEMQSTH